MYVIEKGRIYTTARPGDLNSNGTTENPYGLKIEDLELRQMRGILLIIVRLSSSKTIARD